MIINCHACGKRISDQMRMCPHCHAALGELTPEEIETARARRFKTRMFRARMVTHLGMGVALAGIFWWWLGGDNMMLDWPPASSMPLNLMFLGLLAYIGGRGTMVWLRWQARRRSAR